MTSCSDDIDITSISGVVGGKGAWARFLFTNPFDRTKLHIFSSHEWMDTAA